MDTQTQTLDIADAFCEEEEEDEDPVPEPWGRFFPLVKGFVAQGEDVCGAILAIHT